MEGKRAYLEGSRTNINDSLKCQANIYSILLGMEIIEVCCYSFYQEKAMKTVVFGAVSAG